MLNFRGFVTVELSYQMVEMKNLPTRKALIEGKVLTINTFFWLWFLGSILIGVLTTSLSLTAFVKVQKLEAEVEELKAVIESIHSNNGLIEDELLGELTRFESEDVS